MECLIDRLVERLGNRWLERPSASCTTALLWCFAAVSADSTEPSIERSADISLKLGVGDVERCLMKWPMDDWAGGYPMECL